MRQPQQYNKNRSRNRGRRPGGGGGNNANRVYDSNGPEVKVRGTAQTVADKYTQLARDALSAGHTVTAESYFQHAEHYQRIIAELQASRQKGQSNDGQRRDDKANRAQGGHNERNEARTDAASSPQPDVVDATPQKEEKPVEAAAVARSPEDRTGDAPAEGAEDANWQGHTPDFLSRPKSANGAARPRKARKTPVRPRKPRASRSVDAAEGNEPGAENSPEAASSGDDQKAS